MKGKKSVRTMFTALLASAACLLFTVSVWAETPSTRKTNVWWMPQLFKHLVRELPLPGPAGWTVHGSNDVDDATAPSATLCDNVPCFLWDNSGETEGILTTFRVPDNYNSGLTLYCLVSTDTAAAGPGLDWKLWENLPNTAFDTSATAQDAVIAEGDADTSNEVLVLKINRDGEALMKPGRWITIELFNAQSKYNTVATTELKAVWATYNADR